MGLEIVAVSLGLCTFVDKLRDTKIVIHCDNAGAEVFPLWVHVGTAFFVVIGGGKERHSKVHRPRPIGACAMDVRGCPSA